jgi:hypothetical protein
VLLSPEACFAWLDPARGSEDFTVPLPAGSLAVAHA